MSVDIVTFGCRLNASESETIRVQAERAGLAETVVFNTCAVTNEAVAQARQAIRRVRRERPGARIVVTGCAAQTQPDRFAAMGEVDLVLGNEEKLQAGAWRDTVKPTAKQRGLDLSQEEKVKVADIMAVRQMAPHLLEGFSRGLPRVFVQIQNGCDHRCTFCIIPFGRGNSRSVAMGAVVDQVRLLVQAGHPEIVLTGVDITSYGSDLPGAPRLGKVVKAILRQVPELRRLRLSSIDSVEADADLLDVIGGDDRLMPHLHLSLQSGADMILKRMKRRHSRADAVAFCDQVRRLRPDICLGADLIAGFPTETEAMFGDTLALTQDCGLTFLHVFPFSARPGTPAARMPQLQGAVIKERARRLREAGQSALAQRLAAEVGHLRNILIESASLGRTDHYLPVAAAGFSPGAVIRAPISGHDGRQLAI